MPEEKQGPLTLVELIAKVKKYLVELSYSDETISMYSCIWNGLANYAAKAGAIYYTNNLGLEFIKNHYGPPEGKRSRGKHNTKLRAIKILTDFKSKGVISRAKTYRNYLPPENYKEVFYDYFNHLEKYIKSWGSIRGHKSEIIKFLKFLDSKAIKLSEINSKTVINYLKTKNKLKKSTKSSLFSKLRLFLKFAYEKGYLLNNFSLTVPSIRYNKKSNIPSVFTRSQILKVLNSVDRETVIGKRDYAMILLASELGMRSGDICHLKLENLKWSENKIRFVQAKTYKQIILPMSRKIGEAIIAYIKNGRPKSGSKYIFTRHYAPYDYLTNGTTHSMMRKYLKLANIKIDKGRTCGFHSLRHSFASNLLKKSVSLPVISEILGHKSSEATKIYLKVDITQLRKCALEVPEYVS